ncbi:TonB-dependent receptor, partial [Stenotrophomonas maltophilia]
MAADGCGACGTACPTPL